MRGAALCRASKKRAAKLERWSRGSRSFHANRNLQCKHICTRTDADRQNCLQHAKEDPIAWVRQEVARRSGFVVLRGSFLGSVFWSRFGDRFLDLVLGPQCRHKHLGYISSWSVLWSRKRPQNKGRKLWSKMQFRLTDLGTPCKHSVAADQL